MGIVMQYHKDTDTTYVYESESYYDPSKKQSRSKRKLIGKLDKETGEIIPTGKRGPKKKEKPESQQPSAKRADKEEVQRLEDRILELEKEVQLLQGRLGILTGENLELGKTKAEAERLRSENQQMAEILKNIKVLIG